MIDSGGVSCIRKAKRAAWKHMEIAEQRRAKGSSGQSIYDELRAKAITRDLAPGPTS